MTSIRVMGPADLGAVFEIERTTLTPWSLASLRQELAVQESRCFVAEGDDQQVVGWCACRKVWPEAELLKIAVVEQERRKGIGNVLLQQLLAYLQEQSFKTLFLEVRSQNRSAIAFYNSHGFYKVGLRRAYYSEPQDDALILRQDIC